MVIWGGTIGRTGARYDPIADAWQPTNADNAPSERWGHATVWTGKEMIVWSGLPWPPTSTGGRYCDCADPISVFRDDDGDGLGDSALSVEWCGTAPPPGFSLEAGDNCPATIVTPTVVIASCNSGVRNYMFPDGCNFGDGIAQCRANAGNHGQFVSCVAHQVDTWKGAGLVTGQQGSRIVRCATQ
jgi:hypothetical protein